MVGIGKQGVVCQCIVEFKDLQSWGTAASGNFCSVLLITAHGGAEGIVGGCATPWETMQLSLSHRCWGLLTLGQVQPGQCPGFRAREARQASAVIPTVTFAYS